MAFVLIVLLVEETKERSLESLDVIFRFPKSQFVSWQVRQYLPWFFKRYIFRERPKPERPEMNFFRFIDGAGRAGHEAPGSGEDPVTIQSDTTSVGTVSTSNTRQ